MSLPSVVSESFLAQFTPQSLVPMLRPWRTQLLNHGINVDKYDWKKKGIQPLYKVVFGSEDFPTELRDGFAEVATLSTPTGLTTLTELAAANDWDLGPQPKGGWTYQDVAARAFVEQRSLFDQALARVKLHQTKSWRDYFDLDRGDLAARLTAPSLARLEARLRDHWLSRERPAFAEVRSVTLGDLQVFFLSHAERSKEAPAIREENLTREVLRYHPEVIDVVSYSRESGRLSIHARFEIDAKAIRGLFGEVFWNAPERYQQCSVYTGSPLVALGSGALRDTGGAFAVRVVSCKVVHPEVRRRRQTVDNPDLKGLDRWLREAASQHLDQVAVVTLAFRFPGSRSEFRVQMSDGNKVNLPRHRAQATQVHRYLVDCGLAVAPAKAVRS